MILSRDELISVPALSLKKDILNLETLEAYFQRNKPFSFSKKKRHFIQSQNISWGKRLQRGYDTLEQGAG